MIGVIGAGAFGTALAVAFASAGRPVTLWGRNAASMHAAEGSRTIDRLPDVTLPEAITCTSVLADLARAETILLALPAQQTGGFLGDVASELPDVPLVLCAKGIDAPSLRLQTEIAGNAAPGHALAALTGPGFAGEIARGLPTALTLACAEAERGANLQHLLSGPRLRLYLTDDVIGAQVGGALKNVIAIACGIVEGARLGASRALP